MYVVPKKEDRAAWRENGKGREGETQREHRHSSLSKSLRSGPIFWESGLNLTAGNTTTVCLQAVTEAQAALRAAPHTSQMAEVMSQGRTSSQCFLSVNGGDQRRRETFPASIIVPQTFFKCRFFKKITEIITEMSLLFPQSHTMGAPAIFCHLQPFKSFRDTKS